MVSKGCAAKRRGGNVFSKHDLKNMRAFLHVAGEHSNTTRAVYI